MRHIFIGRWVKGFGRFMALTHKLMHKSPAVQRREEILIFWNQYGRQATKDAFGVSRSTLYLWQLKKAQGELEPKSRRPKRVRIPGTPISIIQAVSNLRRSFPFLGKEKLSKLLKESNMIVSASTIGRIIIREQLPSAPRRYVSKRKRIKRARLPEDYEVKHPGSVVGMDTVVLQKYGRKKYIITAVDYYSRIALARMYSSTSSRNAKNLFARMRIVLGNQIEAVNTDNGGEFLAEYEKACRELTIKHFFTYPRIPKMNPYAERFNRTIQEEATLPLFNDSCGTWNRFIAHYLMLYNFFRQHYALDYKTPVDVFLRTQQSNMSWTHTLCGGASNRTFL